MTDPSAAASDPAQDTISFAELGDGIIVVRVHGRGSFANSVELKRLTDHLADKHASDSYHFIIDLDDCATMDSTFMGVLASVGLRQKRDNPRLMTIVNANEQCRKLLHTLGIWHFVEIRDKDEAPLQNVASGDFQVASQEEVSKSERIIHMIEAHQKLCEVDSENAVRFESVLKYLHESLERTKDS